MDLDKILGERRSTRKFKSKDIKWENVADILNAGRLAPSAGNIQNWVFLVVKDKENKKKLANACSRQLWITEAPVLILVCSMLEKIRELYGTRGEVLYSIQNCAAAIENMLLKSTEFGIDSCWVSAFDENSIIRDFRLDKDVRPQAIIAFGYGDEFEKKSKRNPLENFVFFEEWNNKKRDFGLWPVSSRINKLSSKLKNKFKK